MKHSLLKLTLLVLSLFSAFIAMSCRNNRINQFEQLNSSQANDETARKYEANNSDSVSENVGTYKEYFDVKRVIDGDTFVIMNTHGIDEKIRLTGVNAPESRNTGKKKKEEFGIESKVFLTKLLAGKRVRLEFDVQKTDKYGRTLAYVYLEDGTFLNEYLVKEGYAQVATFPPNVKYKDTFIAAQRYARENKTGLWKTD